MQCYHEVVPPTGVTHSLSASFTSADAKNLIVARTSVLQIFFEKPSEHSQESKLVLVAEFNLSGTITALSKVKLIQSGSGGDALLIAFRDAKLSLVEWNPSQHNITTISIHYYENHDLLQCPWTPDLHDCVSHLTVDPSSRCAAYHFGINNVAVIPFHQHGDDLAMDDFDDIDEEKMDVADLKQTNGDADHKTPYSPSFVLPLTALDPNMLNPVDMAFLHEYREPTIGILYSTAAPSNNMASERKDVMIYAVYTLDIEQRASTTLLSITNLPNDLYNLIPLPLPIGGALLVGGNEIIHIDQGGKINAIAVNEFAKECASLAMLDHSNLRLRLEGCQIGHLGTGNGDMVIMPSDGTLAILSFHVDGRSVSSLSLQHLQGTEVNALYMTSASSITHLDVGKVFIGSEVGDSIVLSTSKPSNLKRQQSRAQQNGTNGISANDVDSDDDSENEYDEDDDLYADQSGTDGYNDRVSLGNLRVLDRLIGLGPINSVAFGRPPGRERDDGQVGNEQQINQQEAELELAMACGRGKAGSVAFLQRGLTPQVSRQIQEESVQRVWSIQTRPIDSDDKEHFDDTVILSTASEDGPARSLLLSLNDGELEAREGRDFDSNTLTVAIGRLSATNHTVQVSANDIRVYDSDFGLAQIFPIVDEDSGEISQVLAATIIEPYVMFIKDDQTISVLKADNKGELDEVELPDNIPSDDVASAGLYLDSSDFFKSSRFGEAAVQTPNVLLFILRKDGNFGIYALTDLKVQIFQYSKLSFLPPLLSSDLPIPKHWKHADEIAEVLLSDLGDQVHQQPYLAIRNTTGDVILYEAFAVKDVEGAYRFRKSATKMADAENEDEDSDYTPVLSKVNQQLWPLDNIDGYQAIFVANRTPAIIMRPASSRPKIHRFRESSVKHVSTFRDASYQNSFIYVDANSYLNLAYLPSNTFLGLSDQPIRRVRFGEEVSKIAYHAATSTYLLATARPSPFQLPQDDEWHPEWTEEATTFLPTTTSSTLKLISSSTYRTISQYSFEPNEHILTLKCLPLSVSEESHEMQPLVAVGTAITKGENAVTRGNIYIFAIASVNPDPDISESNLKIKLITKEDVRGSVSAISPIGSQGFLLASQGQRAMVRGLKEDKTLLPVAFLDVRFHISVAQELRGTGLTILGDAFSGLWLIGYSEEPYKMQLLARDQDNPCVIAADFLPDERSLYIVSSDDQGQLRILEYDPENPKTERGTKLLVRSTFNTGSYQTTMTLIPRTPTSTEALGISGPSQTTREMHDSDSDSDNQSTASNTVDAKYKTQQVLLTSQTGAVALLTPLNDTTYRRLSTLQNILTTADQPCSLNPRAYRDVETDGMGGRGVIDGNIVQRWLELSSWHKSVMVGKVGGTIWDVRSDVEGITSANGLGYL